MASRSNRYSSFRQDLQNRRSSQKSKFTSNTSLGVLHMEEVLQEQASILQQGSIGPYTKSSRGIYKNFSNEFQNVRSGQQSLAIDKDDDTNLLMPSQMLAADQELLQRHIEHQQQQLSDNIRVSQDNTQEENKMQQASNANLESHQQYEQGTVNQGYLSMEKGLKIQKTIAIDKIKSNEPAQVQPLPSSHILKIRQLIYTNHPLFKPKFCQIAGTAIEEEATIKNSTNSSSPSRNLINLKPKPKKIQFLSHHQRRDPPLMGNSPPMETLGVEKYYKTEERILDKKISKDGDNPANQKLNRFTKRPTPGLAKTSYDWSLDRFQNNYHSRSTKPKAKQSAVDAFLTKGVLDSSYNYPLFEGEPQTITHSIIKQRIKALKTSALSRMSNMNIKPPVYWRPKGPSSVKPVYNSVNLDVQNIVGKKYVQHDTKNIPQLPNAFECVVSNTSRSSQVSTMRNTPKNRHGLVHLALDGKTQLENTKPRLIMRTTRYNSAGRKGKLGSTTNSFFKGDQNLMGQTFTSGFSQSNTYYSSGSSLSGPGPFNLKLAPLKEKRIAVGLEMDSKGELPLETPKFHLQTGR